MRLLFSSVVMPRFGMLLAFLLASFILSVLTALSPVFFAALLMVFSALIFLAAFLTALLATATRPSDRMHFSYRPRGIVAMDHHFRHMWVSFRRFIPYDNFQAGPRTQCSRKWIVDKAPMPAFVLKRYLAHVQFALAHIAHRNPSECPPTALHAAKVGGSRHRNFP